MAGRPPNLVQPADTVLAVEHPEYGRGTVLSAVDCGEFGQRLTVYFEHRGNMTVLTSETPLRKVTLPKRRILPNAKKGQTLKQAMAATNKQYAKTLARLAEYGD